MDILTKVQVKRKIVQTSWKWLENFQNNNKISKNMYLKVVF